MSKVVDPSFECDHCLNFKLGRLSRELPQFRNKFLEGKSLLESRRFTNFRSVNDVDIMFQDKGTETAFYARIKVRARARDLFDLIFTERETKSWNPYLKKTTRISENDDFVEIEHILQSSPSQKPRTRRFFKTFFIEKSELMIVEFHSDRKGPLHEFTPLISLFSFHERSEKEDFVTQVDHVVITLKNEECSRVTTDIISFHGVLQLEAAALIHARKSLEERVSSMKNQSADSTCARSSRSASSSKGFGDKRDNLNPDQLAIFEEWYSKMLIHDATFQEFEPNTFVRFLIGNDWKYPTYEQNFLNYVNFHRQHLMGKKSSDFAEFEQQGFLTILGAVEDGPGICLLKLGKISITNMIEQFCYYLVLKVLECVKLSDPKIHKYLIITDASGVSKDQVTVAGIKQISSTLAGIFPDIQTKHIIINLGMMTNLIIKAVRVFLDETTNKKMITVGHSKEQIKRTLLEIMPLSMLPKEYGGNA